MKLYFDHIYLNHENQHIYLILSLIFKCKVLINNSCVNREHKIFQTFESKNIRPLSLLNPKKTWFFTVKERKHINVFRMIMANDLFLFYLYASNNYLKIVYIINNCRNNNFHTQDHWIWDYKANRIFDTNEEWSTHAWYFSYVINSC